MNHPHGDQPVLAMGKPLAEAKAAMILLHGRGASAESILGLVPEFQQAEFAYLAPQAAGYAWYPNRFIAPIASNEPYLSSALRVVGDLLGHIESSGVPTTKTIILGFSQGACLALEYAARNPRRYGGVVGYSGGLIGEQVGVYAGSLEDTPIFLGCSDVDFHIPLERVQASSQALRGLKANVTERIYPGMDHTINEDEIAFVQQMMTTLMKG